LPAKIKTREVAMKTWSLAVVVFTSLFFAGCRTDPSIMILERQNRQLEDEVYRLRGMIQGYEDGGTADDCGPSRETSVTGTKAVKNSSSESQNGATGSGRKKASSRDNLPTPSVEMLGEPVPPGVNPLQNPAGSQPSGKSGGKGVPESPARQKESPGPKFPGARGTDKTGADGAAISPAVGFEALARADSREVQQLVLNRSLTGEYGGDEASGGGVLAVIEPRDAAGRRIDAPGDVAVMIVDPSKTGKAAKLARWDFPASETAMLFRGGGVARGMYVECPWPDRKPDNNRLRLYVRYTTRDGRKLETDQFVELDRPGAKNASWSAADSDLQPAWTTNRSPTASGRHTVETADFQTGESSASDAESDSENLPRRAKSSAIQRPTWSPDRF
jgi:hypothetical protein